jgi:WD40 repeat protein
MTSASTSLLPEQQESPATRQPPYRAFDDRPYRVDGPLQALVFAQDGSLRSVEEPGLLRHWDTEGARQKDWNFLTELETIWAFNSGGTLVAAAGQEVTLWDGLTGHLITEWDQPCWVTAMAFAPSSTQLATGHDDGAVRIWDVATHQLIREIKAHPRPVSALAFNAEGSRLASAGEDKLIRLWDLSNGKAFGTLSGHTDRIPSLAWHPSGQRLFSAGWDTTARVWDIATCDPIILLNSHHGQVFTLALNNQGTLLACADSANRIHLWDIAKHRTVNTLQGHEAEIRCLAFSADGNRLASGGEDGIIHLWSSEGKSLRGENARKGWQSEHDLISNTNAFTVRKGIALSGDGRQLANISNAGLRLWDVEAGRVALQPENAHDLAAIAFSADGQWLAGGGADAKIHLWNAKTGKKQGSLEGQDQPLTTVTFAPDSKTLASSGSSGTDVWLWNLSTVEPILVIPDAVGGCSVETLAFHPNGKLLAVGGIDWLATGGEDGRIALWDITQRGGPLINISGGTTNLAIHPSGHFLAATSLKRTVRILAIPENMAVAELDDFQELVCAVAYSHDGNWLATGGDDHVLRLWNANTFSLEGTFEVDTQIKALCFSPDNQFLYTGNGNGSCYQVQVQKLLA